MKNESEDVLVPQEMKCWQWDDLCCFTTIGEQSFSRIQKLVAYSPRRLWLFQGGQLPVHSSALVLPFRIGLPAAFGPRVMHCWCLC